MRKSTNTETEALILEFHSQGKSIGEIASELGINRSVVTQFLLVHCPETRTQAKTALINRIKAVGVNPSLSLTANARQFGTDVLTIKAVFHDLGLELPTPVPTKRGLANPERAKKILELRQAGLTYRKIAKLVGLSHERIRTILKSFQT